MIDEKEALKRTIGLLNKIVSVDKDLAIQLVNADFRIGDGIVSSATGDEIPIVIGKRGGEWSCSVLGILNGVLAELGAGRIQAECVLEERADPSDRYNVIDVTKFSEWTGDKA